MPHAAPLPASIMAALRYLYAVAMPIAVQKGWLGESDVVNATALLTALVTVGYGIWRTHARQVALTNSAPIGRSTIRGARP